MIRHKVIIEGSFDRNTREVFLARNQHYSMPVCKRWGQLLLGPLNGKAEIRIEPNRRVSKHYINNEVGRIRVKLTKGRDYHTLQYLNGFDNPELFLPVEIAEVIFGNFLTSLGFYEYTTLIIRTFQKNAVLHFYGTDRA